MSNIRSLLSIVDNEAKEYAIYTAENRAIPNMVDGFKPVQRFMIHRALQVNKTNKNFVKLASLSGGVADIGYHHGEGSATEAGALMANTWNNNYPLLDGQGNFGTRIVQEAAASRYIFCKLSDNFKKVFKDLDICPEHEDKEHIPPKYYLPIIPTVLLNGVKGIATGYSTSILPHSFDSVVKSTIAALKGETIEPEVQLPSFSGAIEKIDTGVEIFGIFKFVSASTMEITEVPVKWDRAEYINKVLDPLEDKGFITYDDMCSKAGFGFKVKFKAAYKLDKTDTDRIIRDFKLSQKMPQFIVVIDEKGKLREFNSASELIHHFVKIRMPYIEKRIKVQAEISKKQFEVALAKVRFINMVIKGGIVLSGKTRKQLTEELKTYEGLKDHVEVLLNMNIYHITEDEAVKLAKNAAELKNTHQYWLETTPEVEYSKDLESL
ncbi:DNA topoisomerase II [Shewanella phage Thanatos-1]|nr:DNA topoisomerase II [Shewanella phage Thanatos-1]